MNEEKDFKIGDNVITRLRGKAGCHICEILYPPQMKELDLLKASVKTVIPRSQTNWKGTVYILDNKKIKDGGMTWKWCNHVLIPADNSEVEYGTKI